MALATRVFLKDDPFLARTRRQPYWQKGNWRCHWIGVEGGMPKPCVMAFRRIFTLEKARTVRVHVSADERYALFLNGRRIARGSERGSPHRWFFESYDLALPAGKHTLVAIVWALGDMPPGEPGQEPQHLGSSVYGALAPTAQMSTYPGFILAPDKSSDDAWLGTGVAAWEAKRLPGYAFVQFYLGAQLTGAKLDIDGRTFAWGAERGKGRHWEAAQTLHPGVDGLRSNDRAVFHKLFPATLPAMLSKPVRGLSVVHAEALGDRDPRGVAVEAKHNDAAQTAAWTAFLAGAAITIPAHSSQRVLLNLNNYYCAYNGITVSGGRGNSTVRLHWAESLFDDKPPRGKNGKPADLTRWCPRYKGQRDAFEGKYFVGMGDLFRPDGGRNRCFESLWWHAGRYLEIWVTTGAEALTLHRLDLEETRYPMEPEARFTSADPSLAAISPMLVRVMQTCMHETYVDCPYYEQLMYVGDTRVEVLTTYALTADDRLPRKAIDTFDASRLPSGLTQSRFPCCVQQVIPPFSLWWVVMVRDYAFWRDDPAFVKRMLPGVRGVIDYFLSIRNEQGLVEGPNGWNFMDWVPGWENGIPPDGEYGASGPINWLCLNALNCAGELERLYGDPELAARADMVGDAMAASLDRGFYDAARGLFADNVSHTIYSEHSQCLALLSDRLPPARMAQIQKNLFRDENLSRGTVYFTHYLFEACRLSNRMDVFFNRLDFWQNQRKQGFVTSVECPEPSRSDCHAWGAHPLFHYYATILGIRPTAPGFREVTITPHLGSLRSARGTMAHPQGGITVELEKKPGRLKGVVELPKGITGQFQLGRYQIGLSEGRQKIDLAL